MKSWKRDKSSPKMSATPTEELFVKAEFVSPNDPDLDPRNLVYIDDSDSEESEKCNFDMDDHEMGSQEIVHTEREHQVVIDITEPPVTEIKKEEELIIDQEPIELSDTEDNNPNDSEVVPTAIKAELSDSLSEVTTIKEEEPEANTSLEFTNFDPPPGLEPPPDEQFEIIRDEEEPPKTDENPARLDTSLMDHQYHTDPESSNYCDGLVQNMLIETGNDRNPSALDLLSKFSEMFEHFVVEEEHSQLSSYLRNMKKTLSDYRQVVKPLPVLQPLVGEPSTQVPPVNSNSTSTQVPENLPDPDELCPATPEPDTQCMDTSMDSAQNTSIELPATDDWELELRETEKKAKAEAEGNKIESESVEQNAGQDPAVDEPGNAVIKEDSVSAPKSPEVADLIADNSGVSNQQQDQKASVPNENSERIKVSIKKAQDLGQKLQEDAAKLMDTPIEDDASVDEVGEKLSKLLKQSRKDQRDLLIEIKSQRKRKIKVDLKETVKEVPLEESSDDELSSTDSESGSDQKLNLKRKIPGSGPETPAIVSSTKEGSDVSENETPVVEITGRRLSESESEKENDPDKEIERLLDLTTLNGPRPASSKKVNKVKKLKKKLKKRSSDLEMSFSSSDDDSQSNSSETETGGSESSDEEEKMKIRQNDMFRQQLLAGSDASESPDSNLSEFDFSSDDESSKAKKRDASKEKSAIHEDEEAEQDQLDLKPSVQDLTKEKSPEKEKTNGKLDISDEDDNSDSEQTKKSRPRIKRDAFDREIFSKDFLETEKSPKSASSSRPNNAVKIEKESPQMKSKSPSLDGMIDVSMFENRRSVKEIDLQKLFEKRANEGNVASPSSSSASATPKPVANEDEWITLSSDSDSEISAPATASRFPKRKKMLTEQELQDETKEALKMESQRVERLKEKSKYLSQFLTERLSQGEVEEEELILDHDEKTNLTIKIHPRLVRLLKDHQKEGIKFMYDTVYGSIRDKIKTESGCILAHCMGLGKTLQLIALVNTLVNTPQLKTNKILIVCPKSTIMNWYEEFHKWLKGIPCRNLKIWCLKENISFSDKVVTLNDWYMSKEPGVFVINYEALRLMIHFGSKHANMRAKEKIPEAEAEAKRLQDKRLQDKIEHCLLRPGPDLVVCDEGHLIKNQNSKLNKAITQITTKRRIVLTGTPVQNNLNEYYAMVDWIKPALLGTVKEFNNLYATPIKDGQCQDSTPSMIKRMKQRSMILHRKLSKFVQRKEASVLKEFLPNKYEYVLFVPITPVQEMLYETFLNKNPLDGGQKLLNDYTALRKIWTHPRVLKDAYERAIKGEVKSSQEEAKAKKNRPKNLNLEDGEDEEPDDVLDVFDGHTGVTSNWWQAFVTIENLESIVSSNKLVILFEILRLCKERGEKVLVFSAFVAVLNVVEYFMKKQNFRPGMHYFRLDGSTKREERQWMITKFNDTNSSRDLHCFLISAKAGGQGINLIGANRCVLLDTSWNPSSDQQNIFRIYRLGQRQDCFVYRLIALGTMEEKVYSRSVTKQAMSHRVVDKLQIDRHYRSTELSELYTLTKCDYNNRPQPILPKDDVLATLLRKYPDKAFKYHEHDSLLENKPEDDLTEQEIKEAWDMYDLELKGPARMVNPNGNMNPIINNFMPREMNLLANPFGLPSLDPSSIASSTLMNPFMPAASFYDYNFLAGTYRSPNLPSTSTAGAPNASLNLPGTNSLANSLLRSSLNGDLYGLNPLFNFPTLSSNVVNTSTNASSSAATQSRRLSNNSSSSNKKQSSAPNNMISLSQRQNFGKDFVQSVEKDSLANLSILPDGDPDIIEIPSPQGPKKFTAYPPNSMKRFDDVPNIQNSKKVKLSMAQIEAKMKASALEASKKSAAEVRTQKSAAASSKPPNYFGSSSRTNPPGNLPGKHLERPSPSSNMATAKNVPGNMQEAYTNYIQKSSAHIKGKPRDLPKTLTVSAADPLTVSANQSSGLASGKAQRPLASFTGDLSKGAEIFSAPRTLEASRALKRLNVQKTGVKPRYVISPKTGNAMVNSTPRQQIVQSMVQPQAAVQVIQRSPNTSKPPSPSISRSSSSSSLSQNFGQNIAQSVVKFSKAIPPKGSQPPSPQQNALQSARTTGSGSQPGPSRGNSASQSPRTTFVQSPSQIQNALRSLPSQIQSAGSNSPKPGLAAPPKATSKAAFSLPLNRKVIVPSPKNVSAVNANQTKNPMNKGTTGMRITPVPRKLIQVPGTSANITVNSKNQAPIQLLTTASPISIIKLPPPTKGQPVGTKSPVITAVRSLQKDQAPRMTNIQPSTSSPRPITFSQKRPLEMLSQQSQEKRPRLDLPKPVPRQEQGRINQNTPTNVPMSTDFVPLFGGANHGANFPFTLIKKKTLSNPNNP